MTKFSVRESIRYAFITFVSNFFLLTAVGMTTGAVSWLAVVAPRAAAQRLGVYRPLVIKYHDPHSLSTHKTGLAIFLQEVGKKIGKTIAHKVVEHINNTSLRDLLIIFGVWIILKMFAMFLYLGLIQIMLDIRGYNASSYGRLFSGATYFVPYILASFLFVFLILFLGIGTIIGGNVIGTFTGKVFFALGLVTTVSSLELISLLCLVAAFVGFFAFLIRYIFYGYCLVDNDYSALEALSASRRITRGSLKKLVLLFVSVNMLLYGPFWVITRVTGGSFMSGKMEFTLLNFLYAIGSGAWSIPLCALAMVYAYQRLAD